jgi:flavin-binding protein dodecin
VYRAVEFVASDGASWEAAVQAGIAELAKTIRDLRLARVVEFDAVVIEGQVTTYRVKLRASYRIDARRLVEGRSVAARRVLVIANRTAGTSALTELLRREVTAAEGPVEIHVLVPATAPALAGVIVAAEPLAAFASYSSEQLETLYDDARSEARERLDLQLSQLAQTGATATGEVSFDDPVGAVAAVLSRATFDVIVVSTLPRAASRWLRLDLPRRLQRRFSLPVIHVEQGE